MHSSLLFLSVAAILAFSVSVVTDAEARGSKGPKYERGGKVLSGNEFAVERASPWSRGKRPGVPQAAERTCIGRTVDARMHD